MQYKSKIKTKLFYDVLVLGGGVSGVCAAISAARQGVKTLVVERYGVLGGMLTLGHVDPILGSVSAGTIYDEITGRLLEKHPEAKIETTRNGREIPVNPEDVKILLPNMLQESGADFFLQSTVVDVLMKNDIIEGAIVSSPTGLVAIHADCVIDCTGDGYVAAKAGAKYKIGRDNDGGRQPTTLEFTLDNVDESTAITCFGGSDPVKLANGKRYSEFCKEANARGELPENVTIVRLHRTNYKGERSVNATQANGYDTLNLKDIAESEIILRNQIGMVTEFLRNNVEGYENCRVKSSANTLGVRETRRIMGEYVLQDSDVEKGSNFKDVIVHNAWFLIDIHNPKGGGQAEKNAQPAKPYDIPYRSFVPIKIKNLLVAGRCISGTHRAHGSYRVMGICMAMGEAVGVAAALSASKKITPSELDYKEIQSVLQEKGINLFDA